MKDTGPYVLVLYHFDERAVGNLIPDFLGSKLMDSTGSDRKFQDGPHRTMVRKRFSVLLPLQLVIRHLLLFPRRIKGAIYDSAHDRPGLGILVVIDVVDHAGLLASLYM